MKSSYLEKLRSLLNNYQMEELEKQDIINDYDDMYENWLGQGMNEEEVEEKLGKPSKIIGSLVEGIKRAPKPMDKSTKLISVMPFISLIIFFVLGFGFNGWTYSWMAFLLIPMVAIVSEMGKNNDPHVTTALSPFIATVAFFILGFYFDLWHPGWLVFIIIPILGVFNSRSDMNFLTLITALSPFAAGIIFIVLGEQGYYHPAWLVFLIIPVIGYFHETNKAKMILGEVLLIGGALAYLYIIRTYEGMDYWALFAFAPLVIVGMINGNIVIWDVDGDVPNGYKITVIATLITYFVVSFLTGYWAVTWLIFFAIPVFAINREVSGNEKIISLSPFLATTIFMLLGFFLGIWEYAWLAFLIIPVVAILKSND